MKVRAFILLIGGSLTVLSVTAVPATAATTKFKSCDQMHAVFKYGVAKDKRAADRQEKDGFHRPQVNAKVFADSYKSLDRDKDGTMCEVPK